MGDKTKIQWTDTTWNPIRGCSRVSAGCQNCYAERQAARFSGPGQPYEGLIQVTSGGPRWNGVVRLVEEHLDDPLRWKRPRRIFVNSMSDLFHEALTDHEITRVFGVMARAPQHVFQVLTKRAERMRDWFRKKAAPEDRPLCAIQPWPLPNVWLGVSVEDQASADERITDLLNTPAAVRWVSYEPALGPVEFNSTRGGTLWMGGQRGCGGMHRGRGTAECPREPHHHHDERCKDGLDWIVVGGESGPGARPFDVAWARSTVRACAKAGVPCFVKQLGAYVVDRNDAGFEAETHVWAEGPDAGSPVDPGAWPTPVDIEHDLDGTIDGYQGAPVRVHLKDRKGGDPSEWPMDLRVREWPA